LREIRTLLEEVKTHARTIIDNIEKQFKDIDQLYQTGSKFIGAIQIDIDSLEQELIFLARRQRRFERQSTNSERKVERDIFIVNKPIKDIKKEVDDLINKEKIEDEKYLFKEIQDLLTFAVKVSDNLRAIEQTLDHLVEGGFPSKLGNEIYIILQKDINNFHENLKQTKLTAQTIYNEALHQDIKNMAA
jgi:hypothetical protein